MPVHLCLTEVGVAPDQEGSWLCLTPGLSTNCATALTRNSVVAQFHGHKGSPALLSFNHLGHSGTFKRLPMSTIGQFRSTKWILSSYISDMKLDHVKVQSQLRDERDVEMRLRTASATQTRHDKCRRGISTMSSSYHFHPSRAESQAPTFHSRYGSLSGHHRVHECSVLFKKESSKANIWYREHQFGGNLSFNGQYVETCSQYV